MLLITALMVRLVAIAQVFQNQSNDPGGSRTASYTSENHVPPGWFSYL